MQSVQGSVTRLLEMDSENNDEVTLREQSQDSMDSFSSNGYVNSQTVLEMYQKDKSKNTVSEWDPEKCKEVLISKLAYNKILDHAIIGGNMEIMGMLVGHIHDSQLVIHDSFALPVEGTETRVNAHLESYEYMVQYMDTMYSGLSDIFHIIGWYHSHPGYDLWLSAIDIQTQSLNQRFQDPYLAIVVDPQTKHSQTMAAFRTRNDTEFYEIPMRKFSPSARPLARVMRLLPEQLHEKEAQEEADFGRALDTLRDSMQQISAKKSNEQANAVNRDDTVAQLEIYDSYIEARNDVQKLRESQIEGWKNLRRIFDITQFEGT